MQIQHIYACLCGVETIVEKEDLTIGSVFQCPSCKEVNGRVISQNGGTAWIKVSKEDVKFYNLIKKPEDE